MSTTYDAAASAAPSLLLPAIAELYDLEGYSFTQIQPHGGRNLVYTCHKEGAPERIIRIAFLDDRSREDFESELEYVRYLYEHGGRVSNVIGSRHGRLLEELRQGEHTYFISLFERAPGKLLADNHYRYRDGAPLAEYFYNCGQTLGKLHQLSKNYTPTTRRYDFFDNYNRTTIERIVPESMPVVKEKLLQLVETLQGLSQHEDHYGMVHFDYNDGNYHIDFEDGAITVFDFDNCCYCWYMYDLATLWVHGVGWVQFEPDGNKRRAFMDDYFAAVLDGYRSETELEDTMLELLPLFTRVTLMEFILERLKEASVEMQHNEAAAEDDEELMYLVRCVEDDLPYHGFFHELYSCAAPFQYQARQD